MTSAFPRFAAAISYLFEDRDLLDRFPLAAEQGFEGVELALPYAYSPAQLETARRSAALEVVLFTAPLGDFLDGGEGLAAVPARRDSFRDSLALALEYAEALDASCVQIVAGRCRGGREHPARRERYLDTLVDNLREAAGALSQRSTLPVLEAINDRDFPDYLISTPEQLREVLARCEGFDVGAVFDTAHARAMGVSIADEIARHGAGYCHLQVADGPRRCAPGRGDVDFDAFFSALRRSGYRGWIGAEYRAGSSDRDHLVWMTRARDLLSSPD